MAVGRLKNQSFTNHFFCLAIIYVKREVHFSFCYLYLKSSDFLLPQPPFAAQPYLKLQALQYVPDDETVLQAILRHSKGVVDGVVKVTAAMKLDLGVVLEGFDKLHEVLGSTFTVASTA